MVSLTSTTNTLFRFVRVTSPRIFDLGKRARQVDGLQALLEGAERERRAAAKSALADWSEERFTELERHYRRPFRKGVPFATHLPARRDLTKDGAAHGAAMAASDEAARDRDALIRFALALHLHGEAAAAARCAALLQLIETLIDLPSERELLAPLVVERFSQVRAAKPAAANAPQAQLDRPALIDPSEQREAIAAAWQLRNLYARSLREDVEKMSAQLERELPFSALPETEAEASAASPKVAATNRKTKAKAASGPKAQRGKAPGETMEKALREQRRKQAIAHFKALRQRQEERKAALRAATTFASNLSASAFMAQPSAEIADRVGRGWTTEAIDRLREKLKDLGLLKPDDKSSFCTLYEKGEGRIENETPDRYADRSLRLSDLQGTAIAMDDRVELLGSADLIKVEEQLLGYSEGEISYVENVLAGERRLRRERTTREFETIEQENSLESSTNTSEKRSTTTQSLSSEAELAINSRFNTDVTSSASASGGGTIGVVNMEGQGAFSLGVGIGVDTASRSSERSEFGNEIIDAAVEAVTRSTQTSRTTRSRSLFETLNRYEIDNTGTDADHRRGVYCFVNKHILVTETPYGARWFMRARLSTPGRGLLEERRARLAIASSQVEAPPRFDIGPNDVHPTTYMELARRFRAQGLTPPPQATMHLARTYKSDSSNASEERAEGLEKIAKSAMPLFKAYRRFLITDTIEVPDGYMLQEVRLTIDHGANGLSIPVDLPFKLGGAAFTAIPTLLAYPFIMVPVAMWQVLLLASPLLHHNTDSSAVTATIGNEAQQSNYYFFEADFLIREILQLFGSFSALGEGVLAQIREWVEQLDDQLNRQAAELADAMQDAAQGVANAVAEVFDSIGTALNAVNIANPNIPGVINAILSAFGNFGNLLTANATNIPATLFGPFNDFIQDVLRLVSEAAESAFSDLLAALVAQSENSQLLAYGESYGTTGALPIACNIVALKPSVTITLNACIARTDRALDEWRLQTYERLYQAYLQQTAEFEARAFSRSLDSLSPGTLRQLELRAIRTQLFDALDAIHQPQGGASPAIGSDRIELFEHGIDWDNISYRSYNYGPDLRELREEREGLYHGLDAAHRSFLGAAWAEVLLPLSGNEVLERAMLAYFENGSTQIGAELTNDELAQLWQDVITRRQIFATAPEPTNRRRVILPTDLLVVREDDSLPAVPPEP